MSLAALGSGVSSRAATTPTPPAQTQTAPPSPKQTTVRALLRGETLDINRASVEDLQLVSGIGPVIASRIVQARQERPFENVEALTRVRGVGPRLLARWRVHLSCTSVKLQQATDPKPELNDAAVGAQPVRAPP